MQLQKQHSRGALRERCSENMQQIFRRTPMLKFKQSSFIKITLQHGCSPVNLLHIFRTPFPKDTSGGLLLQLKYKKVTNLLSSQNKESLHLSSIDNGHLPALSSKVIGFFKKFRPLQLGFTHTKKYLISILSLYKSQSKTLFMSVGFFGSTVHLQIQFLSQIDCLFSQNQQFPL